MHDTSSATLGYTTSFADTIKGAERIVPSKFVPEIDGVATVTPTPYAFCFSISIGDAIPEKFHNDLDLSLTKH